MLGYQFLFAAIYPCVDVGAVVVQNLTHAAAFLFEQLEPVQMGENELAELLVAHAAVSRGRGLFHEPGGHFLLSWGGVPRPLVAVGRVTKGGLLRFQHGMLRVWRLSVMRLL
ncbi:hypothetical protein B0T39_07890 [Chromobacterium haemolyticum]|nr:hypothetical protein B0T39_07890 [Chromobacterium haemolyticum]